MLKPCLEGVTFCQMEGAVGGKGSILGSGTNTGGREAVSQKDQKDVQMKLPIQGGLKLQAGAPTHLLLPLSLSGVAAGRGGGLEPRVCPVALQSQDCDQESMAAWLLFSLWGLQRPL